MATRHQVRQSLVSLLYALDINQENQTFINEYLESRKIRNKQKEFTIELYEGICKNLNELDEKLKEKLKNEFHDIGYIEKAILRLGIYELLYTDTDKAIVINEAVELAKELTSSSAFINGILDNFTTQGN